MNAKKMMLSLTLAAAMVFPTAGALFHHTSTAPHHRSFARRHPVITTVAGVAVVHHFLKHRH